MMRSRPSVSVLQKAYDDSYLVCSTAVYYEGQGNEDEAVRCWRSALSQIRANSVFRPPARYAPQTATEKALVDSLRELELQCKERIDLLEALKISRDDALPYSEYPRGNTSHQQQATCANPASPNDSEPGWIGQGTIPAITYPELSRPTLPPRPSIASRTSSEQAVVGHSSSDAPTPTAAEPLAATKLPPYASSLPNAKPVRSSSPDKRTLKTTLRSGRSGGRSPSNSRASSSRQGERPGASKAAALAWSALGMRESASSRRSVDTATPTLGASSQPLLTERSLTSQALSPAQWDSHSRRLVTPLEAESTRAAGRASAESLRRSGEYPFPRPSSLSVNAAANALASPAVTPPPEQSQPGHSDTSNSMSAARQIPLRRTPAVSSSHHNSEPHSERKTESSNRSNVRVRRKALAEEPHASTSHASRKTGSNGRKATSDPEKSHKLTAKRKDMPKASREAPVPADLASGSSDDQQSEEDPDSADTWKQRKKALLKNLPPGVDSHAAKQILNEIVVQGDEVHWSDVAGLEVAKGALREAVVYPFLRPDLFMGLREPARGMLLFGPPGTGKTMLARAVATESKSTFFSISASSLTSKYLGESEKLVRALFALARTLAPSIIFVDEIDSLLSQRSGSGEHEATMRIKTEFLIQWSDLQRAAAGRSDDAKSKSGGDVHRVLVLAATNLPWAIDEAARRRFVRRQYIPLPDAETRAAQFSTLLGQQKHELSKRDISQLVAMTEGFSGSDITALAKDAAMGPLRSLGEALLHMTMDDIRPIGFLDFESSLGNIRPSVSPEGLKAYEDWARQFGERGG